MVRVCVQSERGAGNLPYFLRLEIQILPLELLLLQKKTDSDGNNSSSVCSSFSFGLMEAPDYLDAAQPYTHKTLWPLRQ